MPFLFYLIYLFFVPSPSWPSAIMMIFQAPSSPPTLALQHFSTCKSWTMFTCNSSMNFGNSCPLPPEKVEIFKSLNGWAGKNILSYLKPVEKSWQPSDFLPDAMSEECREVRERAKELPDDYFVVLVGDMITEEALPTYQTMLNTLDGVRDETGASRTSWATWIRRWTAEENRHGDLLNRYLYLSGRVDMRQVEVTIQHLISSGMEIEAADNNPYMAFTYTAFQERATFISHGNTARLAKGYGDIKLAQICGIIAADEKRHENAYCKVMEKLFEVDPNEAVMAFANMMRRKIRMPAQLMYDGQDHTLFDHYSAVAQRIGVYTASDYFDIVDFLVERWHVGDLSGLSGAGREAQDYVCRLAAKLRKLDERVRSKAKKDHPSSLSFSWIFDRTVTV